MAIGPFLFAPAVFATLMAIIALLVLTAILRHKVDPIFDRWSGWALLLGFVVARLAFVIRHWSSFSEQPLRVFYFWQGGFEPWWGVAAAVLSVMVLSTWRFRGLALGVLAVAGVVYYVAFSLTPAPAAQQLPALTLHNLEQQPVTLSAHQDDLVILNLWATWCPPCRREMPMLEQAAEEYPDIHIVLVNQGESLNTIRRYLHDEQLELDHMILMDPHYGVGQFYQSLGTPSTYFFRNNELIATHIGEISREVLADYIKQLRR